MKKKDYIEIELATGFDRGYSEQTDTGVLKGREILQVIRLPIEEARLIIQESVRDLDYDQAARFAKRYKK